MTWPGIPQKKHLTSPDEGRSPGRRFGFVPLVKAWTDSNFGVPM